MAVNDRGVLETGVEISGCVGLAERDQTRDQPLSVLPRRGTACIAISERLVLSTKPPYAVVLLVS